jgi:hypothetical protein
MVADGSDAAIQSGAAAGKVSTTLYQGNVQVDGYRKIRQWNIGQWKIRQWKIRQ